MPGKRKAAKSNTKTKTNKRSHVGYSYRNAWRKFLHAHKGEGLTITELSEMYRDQTEVVGWGAAPQWTDKQNADRDRYNVVAAINHSASKDRFDEDLEYFSNRSFRTQIALIRKWGGVTNYTDLNEKDRRDWEVVDYVLGAIKDHGSFLGITKFELDM